MSNQLLRKAMRNASAAMALCVLVGAVSLGIAAADNKKPASKPSAPAKSTQSHGPSGGGNASHGPSTANHSNSHGPSANGGGARTTTTGGMHNTTTTGSRTTTGGSRGNMNTQRGGVEGRGGAGGNRGAFKSSAPRGTNEHVARNGSAIRTRSDGRVSDVHDAKRGLDVHHGLNGGRRVSMERADHSRVEFERGRPGFVQHPYSYHGHDFARRSYYYHGRAYDRFYRGYGYHGVYLNVYAPGFYYHPAFYGWAYNPWVAPVTFAWGWAGNPWYGAYGYYFQPYPVYPSAALWLTDYIISQNLQAAYAAQHAGAETAPAAPDTSAQGDQPVLTPDVKQKVADEVKNQLALENQEAQQNSQQQDADPASSGIARLLSDGRSHVFVAGGNLDVTDASGKECTVSDGDTLELREAPPANATAANLVVLSSKGLPECSISITVGVQLTDLQEMQNKMRETIDQGLQDLKDKQGTDGLPSLPPSAQGQPDTAQYAAIAPPPDPNVATEIQQAGQQGNEAEKDVSTEVAQDTGAPAAPAPAAAPTTVTQGQTTDEVQEALGAPKKVVNLGAKVIYFYSDIKVTFKDGKVTDVQ